MLKSSFRLNVIVFFVVIGKSCILMRRFFYDASLISIGYPTVIRGRIILKTKVVVDFFLFKGGLEHGRRH